MSEISKSKAERGRVKTVTLDVEYADGSTRQFSVPIGEAYGGVIFDDSIAETVFGLLAEKGSKTAVEGLKAWKAADREWRDRPAYLLMHTGTAHDQAVHTQTKGVCSYPG